MLIAFAAVVEVLSSSRPGHSTMSTQVATLGECAFIEVGRTSVAEDKNGWSGQLILGIAASLAAMLLWPVLSSFWEALGEERYLPMWAFLMLFTLLVVSFAWIQFLLTRSLRKQLTDQAAAEADCEEALQERDSSMGEQLQHWAKAQKEFESRIEELEGELAAERELVYEDGLFYRRTDSERRQPFCRFCHDRDGQLSTVVHFYETRNGARVYDCPFCGENALPDRAAPEDQGEEIPF